MTTGIKITEVRVRLCDRPNEKLKAFATMTINDCFVIFHQIKVPFLSGIKKIET